MFGKRERSVSLHELQPTSHVNDEKVKYFANGGKGHQEPIEYITDESGRKYIVDGNHRYFAALGNGESEIRARESNVGADVKEKLLRSFLGK